MKKHTIYLKLEIKRMMKSFPIVFLITVLLAGGLGLLVWAQLQNQKSDEGQTKITIGVVGDWENAYLQMGMMALENADASRFSVQFVQMTEDEAKQKMELGQISQYLVIPDDFIDSVLDGTNTPITFVSGGSQGDIGSELVQEMTEALSQIVVESQTGLYCLYDVYKMQGASRADRIDAEWKLGFTYANFIFNRDTIYHIQMPEVVPQLSFGGHFLCAAIVVFVLLWGMNGGTLLVKPDLSFERLCASRGIRPWSQSLGAFGGYVLFFLCNIVGIGIIAMIGIRYVPFSMEGIESALDVLKFLGCLIPVFLCILSLQYLLYTMVDGLTSGLLLNFLVATLLGYLSGCFYPLEYFPELIQRIGTWLPTGVCMDYMAACLLEQPVGMGFLNITLYTIVFWILAVQVKQYKMKH